MVLIFGNSLHTSSGLIFIGSTFGVCFGGHDFVAGSGGGTIMNGLETIIAASPTIVQIANVSSEMTVVNFEKSWRATIFLELQEASSEVRVLLVAVRSDMEAW